jgi:ribokinase
VRADPAVVRRLTAASVHLTLGAEGSVVITPDDVITVPGHPVEVVDATGAGDCVVGWLAAGLAAGTPLAEVATRAGTAAALSVTRAGATPSMPTTPDVDAFLRRRPVGRA